jgi:ankyrin repeat protein
MVAMQNGHASRAVVEALEAGASADLHNRAGDSSLIYACEYELKATALLLIQHGASVTAAIEKWINEPDEQT